MGMESLREGIGMDGGREARKGDELCSPSSVVQAFNSIFMVLSMF
jgi:hypothetical protein